MLVSLHVTHFIRNGLIGWENISYKNVLSELPYVKSFKYQECRQFGHLNSKKLFFFFFVKIFIGVHVIYIQNTIYLFRIHTVIIFASVVIRICHEIFQFFFTACVCVCLCSFYWEIWMNKFQGSWHGMREIEMNDERCRVRTHMHMHTFVCCYLYTLCLYMCMLYDATTIHSFPSTLFERVLQMRKKNVSNHQ